MTSKKFEYLKKFCNLKNVYGFKAFFAKNSKISQIREQFTNSRNVCELQIILNLKNVHGLKKLFIN